MRSPSKDIIIHTSIIKGMCYLIEAKISILGELVTRIVTVHDWIE
jgi:hypothetical protein